MINSTIILCGFDHTKIEPISCGMWLFVVFMIKYSSGHAAQFWSNEIWTIGIIHHQLRNTYNEIFAQFFSPLFPKYLTSYIKIDIFLYYLFFRKYRIRKFLAVCRCSWNVHLYCIGRHDTWAEFSTWGWRKPNSVCSPLGWSSFGIRYNGAYRIIRTSIKKFVWWPWVKGCSLFFTFVMY